MSHEGKHAYGEHVESAAYAFGGDSYLQMVQNVGLKGDVGFIAGIASAMSNKENDAINAQGAQELWKLVKNDKGEYSFEWDKSTDLDLSELGLGTVASGEIAKGGDAAIVQAMLAAKGVNFTKEATRSAWSCK